MTAAVIRLTEVSLVPTGFCALPLPRFPLDLSTLAPFPIVLPWALLLFSFPPAGSPPGFLLFSMKPPTGCSLENMLSRKKLHFPVSFSTTSCENLWKAKDQLKWNFQASWASPAMIRTLHETLVTKPNSVDDSLHHKHENLYYEWIHVGSPMEVRRIPEGFQHHQYDWFLSAFCRLHAITKCSRSGREFVVSHCSPDTPLYTVYMGSYTIYFCKDPYWHLRTFYLRIGVTCDAHKFAYYLSWYWPVWKSQTWICDFLWARTYTIVFILHLQAREETVTTTS